MPTRDKDDKPAIEQTTAADVMENEVVSEHRRKLIRASAAIVPAIMTIRSGAAIAATSLYQCREADAIKAAENPPAAVLTKKDAPDEWVRVRGVEVSIKESPGQNVTYYCVEKTPGVWECWDESGTPAMTTIGADEIRKGKEVKLIGYVDDATGNYTFYPQGLYVSDQLASPITGSCLCSLHPEMDMCQNG